MSKERFPGEKYDVYGPLWPVARAVLDRQFERDVHGVENIPEEPAVFAVNHLHFFDSPLTAISYTEATGQPMRFVSKNEYFQGGGIDDKGKFGRPLKWLVEHSQMIPVDRENGGREDFDRLLAQTGFHLAAGDAIGIHPEGTRSYDGWLHKFKSGAGAIALAHAAPLVPVGILYERKTSTQKQHVDIMFGEPIMPSSYHHGLIAHLPLKQQAETLVQMAENRVAALTHMKQTGQFATLRKLRGKLGDS